MQIVIAAESDKKKNLRTCNINSEIANLEMIKIQV